MDVVSEVISLFFKEVYVRESTTLQFMLCGSICTKQGEKI